MLYAIKKYFVLQRKKKTMQRGRKYVFTAKCFVLIELIFFQKYFSLIPFPLYPDIKVQTIYETEDEKLILSVTYIYYKLSLLELHLSFENINNRNY